MLIDEQEDTQSWVGDVVSVHALRTLDFHRGGTLLFLVYPVLEANLVDPLCRPFALTGTSPLAVRIFRISSKTHPAGAAGEGEDSHAGLSVIAHVTKLTRYR